MNAERCPETFTPRDRAYTVQCRHRAGHDGPHQGSTGHGTGAQWSARATWTDWPQREEQVR